MLTKSFSPRVSRIVLIVCLAIVSLSPFMLPLTSTTIITSLGEVAAWMYLKDRPRDRWRLGKEQGLSFYLFLLFLLTIISLLSSLDFLSQLYSNEISTVAAVTGSSRDYLAPGFPLSKQHISLSKNRLSGTSLAGPLNSPGQQNEASSLLSKVISHLI